MGPRRSSASPGCARPAPGPGRASPTPRSAASWASPIPDHRAAQKARHAARSRDPVRRHRRGSPDRDRRPAGRRGHRRRAGARGTAVADAEAGAEAGAGAGRDGEGPGWQVASRIETGTITCRYAGAMLAHAFTDRIGARGLLSAGTAASAAGAPAPVDDLASWCAPRFVHPRRADTGAGQAPDQRRRRGAGRATSLPRCGPGGSGWASSPTGATRWRCSAVWPARCSPSSLPSRSCTWPMTTSPSTPATRRRARPQPAPRQAHQGPRRHLHLRPVRAGDRVQHRGTLSSVLHAAARAGRAHRRPPGGRQARPGHQAADRVRQRRRVPRRLHPARAAGYDWLTWRRAPLAPTTLLPVLQTITTRGRRRELAWTDEQLTLKDYAKPVRQLSLFEHGHMLAQAISGHSARARRSWPGGCGAGGPRRTCSSTT